MYKRGFWTGLLVGLVLAGVIVASLAGLVMLRGHATAGPMLGLRLRSFGWSGQGGRLPFGMPARACGGLLCLALPLLVLGTGVVIAVFVAHRCWRHGCWHPRHEEQKPGEMEAAQTEEVKSESAASSEQPPAQS